MLGETPHHDAGLSQRLKHAVRVLAPHQAEQRGAADHLEPRFDETGIEPQRRLGELGARPLLPLSVGERRRADGERSARDRPWPERRSDARGDLRCGQGKAQPETGQTIKFAE